MLTFFEIAVYLIKGINIFVIYSTISWFSAVVRSRTVYFTFNFSSEEPRFLRMLAAGHTGPQLCDKPQESAQVIVPVIFPALDEGNRVRKAEHERNAQTMRLIFIATIAKKTFPCDNKI